VLRLVLSWAKNRSLIDFNHATGGGRLYIADRSDKIWTAENIADFMKVARPEMQLAMLLALHTGQRQGDLLALPWSAFDGRSITLRQKKTGREVYVPCTDALQTALRNTNRVSVMILNSFTGKPWKGDRFRSVWRSTVQQAGIEGLTFHDIRGTSVTMLAEADCTTHEIATITGHSLQFVERILDVYSARTKHLANSAILKFENRFRTETANQLQTVANQNNERTAK